ncbi:dihydrofolate reductase [Proteus phage 2]|nr:dihydrofolate reductase [Proteus phage 1]QNN97863.1 dihydrofolate reductase [Proteus phage 2]QOC54971.1 dihydrofolate reductase [Proteus phage M4H10_20]
MISLHFAVGSAGEFGLNGKLPWGSIPKELETFWKGLKSEKPNHIVMGRNTFDSLPKAVIDRLKELSALKVVDLERELTPKESTKLLYDTLTSLDGKVSVIGGAFILNTILTNMIELVDKMYISVMHLSMVNPRTMSYEPMKADTYLDMAQLNFIFDNLAHRRTIVEVDSEFTSMIMEMQ